MTRLFISISFIFLSVNLLRSIVQCRSLREPGNYRPVLLVTGIFFLREVGGNMVIFMYAVYFFENAGVIFDPFTCSVLLGVSRLVFTLVSALIIDKLGRRPLLIVSALVCSLALYVTGIYEVISALDLDTGKQILRKRRLKYTV